MERLVEGRVRVGIHIAAPTLLFGQRPRARELGARAPLDGLFSWREDHHASREGAIGAATLAAGRTAAAASLYVDVDPATLEVLGGIALRARVYRREPAHRGAGIASRMPGAVAAGHIEGAYGDDLYFLWRLARRWKADCGAGEERSDRPDYTFAVTGGA